MWRYRKDTHWRHGFWVFKFVDITVFVYIIGQCVSDSQVCGNTRRTKFCQACTMLNGTGLVGINANCNAYWQCEGNGFGVVKQCGENQVFIATGDCRGSCEDQSDKNQCKITSE